ncbi:ribosome recycling factor family protein [Vibrio aestuarianus]|uniref:Ribosome recycling factor family protein n=1 Tax=Vibrio aestuarianus TaxID=28171 RepID=A0ABD7YMQ5_9VIBR|nr:ribosome recycling factor family protein [Vibrio aestuarianus]MDE1327402.1 ribosome recycling factor family protein [Vibrio aestuarianus]MDE1351818.1 ribosome recycling factor family protein [Vibrio aestuarianus]WGK86357.1 ribosome recycling factor family protein [Vibrio aestuarianus]CAH8198138.1 putative Ribosome recycling factor [Vibrio aestuarianus]
MESTNLTIPLPSLIHRIGGDNAKRAKQVAFEYGCELKRVRRSRNWQISGEISQLKCVVTKLSEMDQQAMLFLITKVNDKIRTLEEKLEPREDKLTRLVLENPNITLSELMALTNCSVTEARTARFATENF